MIENTLWKMVHFLLLVFLLIPICKEDLQNRTISNRKNLLLGGAGLLTAGISSGFTPSEAILHTSFVTSAEGALAACGLGLLCRGVGGEGFGWGDVKLLGALGAYLTLTPFLRGMAVTGVFSLLATLWLLLFRKAKPSDALPFAPFLAAGTVLSEGMECFMAGGPS